VPLKVIIIVILIIFITIRHESRLDRPFLASSCSLCKDLPRRLRPFGIKFNHYIQARCRPRDAGWMMSEGVLWKVDCVWNVMAHAQKPDFVFRAKRMSPFKSVWWRQFSRLLAAEVCASAVVMLDTPCSEVVWRLLATPCVRQFPLHFPSRASPCVMTSQLDSTSEGGICLTILFVQQWRNITCEPLRMDRNAFAVLMGL